MFVLPQLHFLRHAPKIKTSIDFGNQKLFLISIVEARQPKMAQLWSNEKQGVGKFGIYKRILTQIISMRKKAEKLKTIMRKKCLNK